MQRSGVRPSSSPPTNTVFDRQVRRLAFFLFYSTRPKSARSKIFGFPIQFQQFYHLKLRINGGDGAQQSGYSDCQPDVFSDQFSAFPLCLRLFGLFDTGIATLQMIFNFRNWRVVRRARKKQYLHWKNIAEVKVKVKMSERTNV